MVECQKCGSEMYYDTNKCLVCPVCDKEYAESEGRTFGYINE